MKTLLLALSFVTFSAHAELITQGGFGTDGATLESMPSEESVAQATKIYNLLRITPVGPKEMKTIELEEGSLFECEAPRRGVFKYTGGCSFVLRASQNAKVTKRKGLAADVTFSGTLAQAVFKSLGVRSDVRAGGSTRAVENLNCQAVTGYTSKYSCTLKNVNVIQMDVKI
jgi:hypothetical protein